MFTRATIRDGSSYLGNHLCANDYYSEDEKVSGVWQGELARTWGIEGQRIDAGDARFENLRVGLTPDGEEKLTQRGGGEVRFCDFQCAASKSVSVQSMFDARLAEASIAKRKTPSARQTLTCFIFRFLNSTLSKIKQRRRAFTEVIEESSG
jgi:hypothetical protein